MAKSVLYLRPEERSIKIRKEDKNLIALLTLVFSVSVNAITTHAYDFTDVSIWGGLDGNSHTTLHGLTFDAVGGNMTVNQSHRDPRSGHAPCYTFTCTGDGIGIRGDEINGSQRLTISTFDIVTIHSVSFLDTFIEGHTEVASFFINNDVTSIFSVLAPGNHNGYAEWTGLLQDVSSITFFSSCDVFNTVNVINGNNGCNGNDFSVAGINVNPVPLPATIWLLASGLLGLIATTRRNPIT